MKEILKINFIILLILCSCRPDHAQHKKYMNHLGNYIIGDQGKRNEFHKKQAVDDLEGCPTLVDLGKWEYDTKWSKGSWQRHQSWRYPDGIWSEESTGIRDSDKKRSDAAIMVYIGPWHKVHLKSGYFFNKKEEAVEIRFTAFQKKNNIKLGYIYTSFEFKTPQNENIPEQPIKIIDGVLPDAATFCEVKWIAKYGYNGVLDLKTNQIIEAKE